MIPLSNYHSFDQYDSDAILSHLVLILKLDVHCIFEVDQDFTHTARTTIFQIKPMS
jgi:hypothetical protein